MFQNYPVSAAPFVYAILAGGLVCGVVIAVSIAREARAEKRTEAPRRRKAR
jgi:hypothetical protein